MAWLPAPTGPQRAVQCQAPASARLRLASHPDQATALACPVGGSSGCQVVRRVCLALPPRLSSSLTLLENLVKPPPNSLRSPLYRALDRLDFPSARPKHRRLGGHDMPWPARPLSGSARLEAARQRPCPRPWPPARVSHHPQFHCLPPISPSWLGQWAAGSPAADAVRWPQAQRRACTMTSKISNPPPFKVGFSARFSFVLSRPSVSGGFPPVPVPPLRRRPVQPKPAQAQHLRTFVSTQHRTGTH